MLLVDILIMAISENKIEIVNIIIQDKNFDPYSANVYIDNITNNNSDMFNLLIENEKILSSPNRYSGDEWGS